jgi:hypothetical protein
MKGWHKHGVCGEECWPHRVKDKSGRLTEQRTSDALLRPLGAYYRVNHQDFIAMHSAMAEVGILYATATVHEGWNRVDETGIIPFTTEVLGGHAFAIVAYDERGFWIQNSWGESWGNGGFGLITYDDWLTHASDVWVARLGAPVTMRKTESTAISHSATAGKSAAYSYADLRPHIISLGNNGRLEAGGNFGTSEDEVRAIFEDDFPRVTERWTKKRLLLFAHGGLVDENAAVQRLADYRTTLLENEIYPVSCIWHSDTWSTITNILQEALRLRRPEGFLDASKDFMFDRLDDALEPVARKLTGRAQWDEMKENALLATTSKGGGMQMALESIVKLATRYGDDFELHLVSHSAGSILHAPLVQLVTSWDIFDSGPFKGMMGHGMKITSCTLWAPACTTTLFKQLYLPAIKEGSIERFTLFTLTDPVEEDDNCAQIYHKSLLYLVSNALEAKLRNPLSKDGEPLLGMEKFIRKDPDLMALFASGKADWVLAPNHAEEGTAEHSSARHHGDFDNDIPTITATFARILNRASTTAKFTKNRSVASLKEKRRQLTFRG